MQGSTLLVGEPTIGNISIGLCLAGGGGGYFSTFSTVRVLLIIYRPLLSLKIP